jgi:hypothetical protein
MSPAMTLSRIADMAVKSGSSDIDAPARVDLGFGLTDKMRQCSRIRPGINKIWIQPGLAKEADVCPIL